MPAPGIATRDGSMWICRLRDKAGEYRDQHGPALDEQPGIADRFALFQ